VTIEPFMRGWELQRSPDAPFEPVALPHDAMIAEPRRADAPSGFHGGYFLGGSYRYRTTWTPRVEHEGKQLALVFEGVHGRARVLVDGRDLGGNLNGHTAFEVPLAGAVTVGAESTVEVTVDNTELPAARWYTGAGIDQPVWLRAVEAIHIEPDGVRFHTTSTDGRAVAEVDVAVANPDGGPIEVVAVLRGPDGEAARSSSTTSGSTARLELTVDDPRLWSADEPNLYDLSVSLGTGDHVHDEHTTRVGLRTITVDARRGLRVNGVTTSLRGACVHHDSGVLGSATFAAAERRRVRILKEQGFNAIRSAHNPMAPALLDACDELGMYVMDELFDSWYLHKTEHDEASDFHSTWEAKAEAMVVKDRNRPSVVLYSIGNENGEPASAFGHATAQRLADRIRDLDPTRPVTAGVNLAMAAVSWPGKRKGDGATAPVTKKPPKIDSTAINVLISTLVGLMQYAPKLRRTDVVTEDLFEVLDVAGYNYGPARYELDARLHPDRVVVGTETIPGDIPRNWDLVERLPNLIGDFMWTGWDYLGETGIGTWAYGARLTRLMKLFPHLTAGCGVVDITGRPGALALLARATWGALDAPAITVRPPDLVGQRVARSPWRSTDAVASWSWRGCEGKPAHLEVISDADEVEVLVNGRSLGRRPAGRAAGFVSRFETTYAPGEVVAIGYVGGTESGRSSLRSAGPVGVRLVLEPGSLAADGQDLAFVHVELADDDGNVEMLDDDLVTVTVEGPAALAGFGSEAPATEEPFVDAEHTTYRGRALAVIRAGSEPGPVTIKATSRWHGSASVVIDQGGSRS
jgi:beta-galactosidase